MKSTPHFKQTILSYLEKQAQTDELFVPKFKNPAKNIDDCITYILNTVKKTGCNGFHRDEIFGMAIHYYQEDNIEVGKQINCHVVVNHPVELTEEEKAEAKEEAIKKCIQDEYTKLHKKAGKPKIEEKGVFTQASLF